MSYSIQMHLREMEDKISRCVSARDHIEPQLPHEKHNVGYVDWPTYRTHTQKVVTENHQMSNCHTVQMTFYYRP